MTFTYYDREGRLVSRQQWQQLARQDGYTCVAHANSICHGQQITVVTYWLGAGSQPTGAPLVFQTYAEIRSPGSHLARCCRTWGWATLEGARAGHEAITGWLTGVAAGPCAGSIWPPAPPMATPAPIGCAQVTRGLLS